MNPNDMTWVVLAAVETSFFLIAIALGLFFRFRRRRVSDEEGIDLPPIVSPEISGACPL